MSLHLAFSVKSLINLHPKDRLYRASGTHFTPGLLIGTFSGRTFNEPLGGVRSFAR